MLDIIKCPKADFILLKVKIKNSRSQGTLECLVRIIKGELWIEYIMGETRTPCEGKIRNLRTINFLF